MGPHEGGRDRPRSFSSSQLSTALGLVSKNSGGGAILPQTFTARAAETPAGWSGTMVSKQLPSSISRASRPQWHDVALGRIDNGPNQVRQPLQCVDQVRSLRGRRGSGRWVVGGHEIRRHPRSNPEIFSPKKETGMTPPPGAGYPEAASELATGTRRAAGGDRKVRASAAAWRPVLAPKRSRRPCSPVVSRSAAGRQQRHRKGLATRRLRWPHPQPPPSPSPTPCWSAGSCRVDTPTGTGGMIHVEDAMGPPTVEWDQMERHRPTAEEVQRAASAGHGRRRAKRR